MDEKIREIMASIFSMDINEINDATSPDNTEAWDSLKHINLVTALEEEFDIRFTNDEIIEMLNYQIVFITVKEKVENA